VRSTDPVRISSPEWTPEITEADDRRYLDIVSTELTDEQQAVITTPPEVYYQQDAILALHWHPEHIPMPLIRTRIKKSFPNSTDELIIPTQHNELLSYGEYTGAEVDCYAASFHRKVQLLFHFLAERLVDRGDVFKAMVAHTQRYRSSQLLEFIDSVLDLALERRVAEAAEKTGADDQLVEFVRIHVDRLKRLIDANDTAIPPQMFKNKLVREYFNALGDIYDAKLINHAQLFLKAVKEVVKREFSLEYFYRAEELIEEVRSLGGCVVVPHPEQFWPILLERFDVDGIEVWNPQSFQYTQFLIEVVDRKNRSHPRGSRPLLVTMGDDCHMGEKVKDPRYQVPEKAGREIGVQPPWDDLIVRKCLIAANQSRGHVIEEYRGRLSE